MSYRWFKREEGGYARVEEGRFPKWDLFDSPGPKGRFLYSTNVPPTGSIEELVSKGIWVEVLVDPELSMDEGL